MKLNLGEHPKLRVLFGQTESTKTNKPAQPVITHRMQMPAATDTFHYKNGEKTTVETLIGGGQVFHKIDEVLKKAKSVVLLDMYNFQSPSLYPERSSPPGTPGAKTQSELMDRLINLRKEGLNVKVVLDNGWDDRMDEGHNDRAIAHLRKNGVDVVTYPDFAKINHVKILLVDNQYAIIGGMNWGNHSAANHDAAVFIEGPDVRNVVNKVFKTDWVSSGRDASELPKVPDFDEGKIKLMLTSSKESAEGAKDEIYQELLQQIGNAKDSIYAELFVLTQKNIVDNLIFAHKRLTKAGKEGVKILVDPGLFFTFPNCRPGVQKLAKAGIPIQFYAADRDSEEKLHGKWAVFDKQRLFMGSANWSNLGLLSNGSIDKNVPDAMRISRGNHEVATLIDSEKIARPFVQQMQYDWEYNAFPILEMRDGRWRAIKPDNKATNAKRPARQQPQAPAPATKKEAAEQLSLELLA